MHREDIGRIEPPNGVAVFGSLFQSGSQIISYLVTICLIVILMYLISFLFGDGSMYKGVLLGVILGSIPALYAATPQHFVLNRLPTEVFIKTIEDRLWKFGYKVNFRTSDRIEFISRLPRFLSWKENNITINITTNSLCFSGARIAVTNVRRWLLREAD
jgi:hypothetical protein